MSLTVELVPPLRRARTARARPRVPASPRAGRTRVLLTTEGTYPYVVGGVSSWCDLLVSSLDEFDWHVLPIVAGGQPRRFALPPHATEHGPIEVWSEQLAARRAGRRGRCRSCPPCWSREPDRLERRHGRADRRLRVVPAPPGGRAQRRSAQARHGSASSRRCGTCSPSASRRPAPRPRSTCSTPRTSTRRSTGSPAPPPRRRREADVLHVTAAGWSAIPALVNKVLHGTPMVLTEHGVYVRESYLAAIRNGGSAGSRFTATRLARGLARCAYAGADVIAPVTDANAYWEMGFGIDPAKILVLYNGLDRTAQPRAAAGRAPRRLGRAHRPAEGHPHDAAHRRADAAHRAGGRVPPLRPDERRRGGVRALVPRAARAAASSGTGSASWAARPTRRASCATPTWC